ncbi:MAG TPA: M20 family metallopeptidase [Alphaproteobacteria bacterium]|nr:M20 family metallopeptidase [Alphaproteobacteria bacterium]
MTTPVDLGDDVQRLTAEVVALRRELHQHPELAFEEVWTAATLAARMRSIGLGVDEGIGGTGVLAVLEGAASGKTLLVRADMDALPMAETTGREYASKIANRNHSCGHDVNSAVVAGVAALLARHRDRIAGRVAFVFQPADEPMRGARRMIEDGLLQRIQPDMSMSVHVLPQADAGQVVIQRGPIWASWDTRILTIGSPPAGGARNGFDIARLSAHVVTTLYDLVELEARSADDVTFRVRSLNVEQRAHGDPSQAAIEVHLGRGEPSQATIEVNLALYDNALRRRLLDRIEHVAAMTVAAAGGSLSSAIDHALPALVNDHRVTGALERAARRVVGAQNIVTNWRNRFSDDFGLFMETAPGCLMLLGTANAKKGITETWHRPGFDVDEDALPVGVHIMSLAALDLLRGIVPNERRESPA